jgi:hypothetical protein
MECGRVRALRPSGISDLVVISKPRRTFHQGDSAASANEVPEKEEVYCPKYAEPWAIAFKYDSDSNNSIVFNRSRLRMIATLAI